MDYDVDIMNVEPTIVNENSTMYTYCNQNLPHRRIFPFLSSAQEENWMTEQQKLIVSAHRWVGLAITIVIVFMYLKNFMNFIWEFYRGKESKSRQKRLSASWSQIQGGCYIPQIKSCAISYPLFACSIDSIIDKGEIQWNSPYHPHKYYDLTDDAKQILKEAGVEGTLSKSAFSQVTIWE